MLVIDIVKTRAYHYREVSPQHVREIIYNESSFYNILLLLVLLLPYKAVILHLNSCQIAI